MPSDQLTASSTLRIRPISGQDLFAVPGKCWEGRDSQERLLARQEILGFAAWEGDVCVGQLHCYRVVPPQWDDENFPSYGRRDPRSWPLGWPLQVARKHAAAFCGPIWGHGCFHVGLLMSARDVDLRYSRRGIGTMLCRASIMWAKEHGYSSVLAVAGAEAVPDYNVWMGCLPWKVYERLGAQCVEMEENGERLPWWIDQCPPIAQEQLQKAVQAGAAPKDLCARTMALKFG